MKGIEIKEKRIKLGLTQKKLAELLGVSYQTVNGYENGKEIPSTKFQILEKILNEIPKKYQIYDETIPPRELSEPDRTIYSQSDAVEKKIYELHLEIQRKEKELSEASNESQKQLLETSIKMLYDVYNLIKNNNSLLDK